MRALDFWKAVVVDHSDLLILIEARPDLRANVPDELLRRLI